MNEIFALFLVSFLVVVNSVVTLKDFPELDVAVIKTFLHLYQMI